MRLMINGALGAMGQVLSGMASESPESYRVVAGIDGRQPEGETTFPIFSRFEDCHLPCDVIVDFSVPEALQGVLEAAKLRGCAIVVATTGLDASHLEALKGAAEQIPVFRASNMSLGVNLQADLIKQAANVLGEAFDIEIIEKHHNQKVDAPSGTALTLAEEVSGEFAGGKELVFDRHTRRQKRAKREIGLHSVRGGTVVGEHQVLFLGTDEVLEVNHIAHSKRIFAFGALRASSFVAGKEPGLYNMNQMLAEETSVTRIAASDAQSLVSLRDISHQKGEMADVFDAVSHINIDMISQTKPDDAGNIELSFTLPTAELREALAALKGFDKVDSMSGLARLTIEGPGMEHKSGVAAGVFRALMTENISILLVTTSETKISFCIQEAELEPALAASKRAFGLT